MSACCVCFVPEELPEITESTASKAKTSSKAIKSRTKTARNKSSKRAKLGKKLKRYKTAESAGESHPETSVAGISVSSSGQKKKGRVKKNQFGSSDISVSENGPLDSSMLKMKSPPILAPLKTKLPPVLVPKPKKRSKNKHYLCSECGRELKSKSALEIHVRMHTDSRPFTCPICGRGFRANGGLTRHQVLLVETLLSDCIVYFFLPCSCARYTLKYVKCVQENDICIDIASIPTVV